MPQKCGCSTDPARYAAVLIRPLLHGSWLSRAVRGRCDGSRGTAALDRGAQHSRKSWLENAAEQARAPRSAAQGTEIYCQTRSQRETASSTLPRDKKRSFIDAATFGPHRSRDMTARPRRRQNRTQQSPWKSPASNRPPSPDFGRDAAPRPGRALGVESKFRIACAPFRAQAFTRNPKTTFRGFARNRSRGPQGRISATIDTKNAGHGQLPHARPADELQDETHDATTRQAARLRGAVGLAHGR